MDLRTVRYNADPDPGSALVFIPIKIQKAGHNADMLIMIKVEEIWCEQKRIYFIWGAESLILATVSVIHFILGLFLLPGSG